MSQPKVAIIGGGLAGSEAALQLAYAGVRVRLYDIKPMQRSAAHHSNDLAEIVCSNSMGSLGATASGLLKLEMMGLGSHVLRLAQQCSVPAGKALAVDRDAFARTVTQAIHQHPNIEFVSEEITQLPVDVAYCILATGPMTTHALAEALQTLTQRERLFFFDAASPIITKESIDFSVAFFQDRYNKATFDGAGQDSYINCPLNEEQYKKLVAHLLSAEKTPLKSFEEESLKAVGKTSFFESCLPVEVIASRGIDTLRFGPMKPVGLCSPHTGSTPYAAVQLRQDNAEGTLYNMVGFQTNLRWGEQKTLIQGIPGLEEADIVRYGVMHRNTYVHSPEVLQASLQVKQHPNVFIAGQLTGTEGYTESIATGMLAALNVERLLQDKPLLQLPKTSMLGALTHYITRPEAIGKEFQPINSNWGLMPLLEAPEGKKKMPKAERGKAHCLRALRDLQSSVEEQGQGWQDLPSAWLESLHAPPAIKSRKTTTNPETALLV